MFVRIWNTNESGEVKNHVSSATDLAHRVDVADVAKRDLQIPHYWLGNEGETTTIGT
jgi:hypothetical protein